MNTLFDVIIIGAGPVGLVMAQLLGQQGVRVALVEKNKEVWPFQRATHIDEETLRNLQMTHLLPLFWAHTAPFGHIAVANAQGKLLLTAKAAQRHSPHGYEGSRFFDQPAFERILRSNISTCQHISTFYGMEACAIRQSDSEVSLVAIDAQTVKNMVLKAKWLIGADGAKSFVRTAANIGMQSFGPSKKWLLVDTILQHPEDERHLPSSFCYYLGEKKTILFAKGVGLNRRWEFSMGEQEKMPSSETLLSWLKPYIDPDRLLIQRVSLYTHHALMACTWRTGRLLLAGDAAHQIPPAAGQGLCTGIRDAVNLAWKLARVVKKQAPESLIDSYFIERGPFVKRTMRQALLMGAWTNQGKGMLPRKWREWQLRFLNMATPLTNYLYRLYHSPRAIRQGIVAGSHRLAGAHIPQWQNDPCNDEGMGYQPCLLALSNTAPSDMAKAKALGFATPYAPEQLALSKLGEWMRLQGIDFAMIRPDKIIFGAGKASELHAMLQAWEAQVGAEPLAPPILNAESLNEALHRY